MSDCITCDEQTPNGPAHSLLVPKVNPDTGSPAPAAFGACPEPGDSPEQCHDGYRVPTSSAQTEASAVCGTFLIESLCAERWAYAGLLIELPGLGYVEVTAVEAGVLTVKNLTVTPGAVILARTLLRVVPRAPLGQQTVADSDVQDPAAAESGVLSSDVRMPVGVPVSQCGPDGSATGWALGFRKGWCGVPLTTAADQTQLVLVGWNPVTKCLHFLPNGQEGDRLEITGGKPAWSHDLAGKYVFKYTGAVQLFTVPEGFTSAVFKVWGAGGSWDGGVLGGVGGFTTMRLAVTPGDKWSVVVGEGVHDKLGRTYGFGGAGQGPAHQHNGGGLSGVFTGDAALTAADYARALIVAGGGGSGAQRGGGSFAVRGANGNGTAGTPIQTADMQGADATGGLSTGGGGGGGGYRGGASGGQAGWGGTGFTDPAATEDSIEESPYATADPPRTTDIDYISGVGRSGQPGLVVIEFFS